MVPPRGLQDWADVETEDDFVAYLGLLAADARDPGSRWSSRDLPEFLHGWARWIDDALAQGRHADLVRRPSRRALAGQLFHARTAARATAATGPVVDDPDRVASAADLASWLGYLGDDCRDDDTETRKRAESGGWAWEGRWAHGTSVWGYLDAWHAYLSDTRAERARFKARTWAEVASALEEGKFYE